MSLSHYAHKRQDGMTKKEEIKNDILIAARVHLSMQQLTILENIIDSTFYGVDVIEKQNALSTHNNTNEYFINLFLAKKATKLSARTADQYIRHIKALLDVVHKPLNMMTEEDIDYFLLIYKKRGNKNSTVNNCRRFVSAFFTWMRKSKLVIENPCDNVEKYTEITRRIEHLEPEQWEQLKTGCVTTRDRALLEFLRCTAMRDGEVPFVHISDVDWQEGKIVIFGQKSKKHRLVCIDRVASDYLRKYLKERGVSENSNEHLFVCTRNNNALNREGIYAAIKKIAERAKMSVNIYPHLLRKTTATNIVKRGGSVVEAGEYLGHADRNTAGQYYAYRGDDHIVQIFKNRIAAV